jgi:hypothetical protein
MNLPTGVLTMMPPTVAWAALAAADGVPGAIQV